MGYYYWLEVNKKGNVISFKVSTDVNEDEKVIEYEVENDNADMFLNVYMFIEIGKYYPWEDEYEPVFKKVEEIFSGLDLTELRNMIIKEYPPRNDDSESKHCLFLCLSMIYFCQ